MIAFILGFFIGGAAGIFITALAAANKEEE